MIIKLNQTQKDVLFNIILKDNVALLEKVKKKCSPFYTKFHLDLDVDLAIEVRDLCEDTLISVGFDINYEPNEIGKICEDLSNSIYVALEK